MEEKNEEYYDRDRSRSVAIIVRDKKILMEKVHFFERDFCTLPGGGIEKGETPEQAVLRELTKLKATGIRLPSTGIKEGIANHLKSLGV